MQKIVALISFLWLLNLVGCVGNPPLEEYTLAKIAIDAAKAVDAPRHSSGYYHQAEESYTKAKELYNDRDYVAAKKLFLRAKQTAEKAENSARLIRYKNGEVL